MIKVSLLKNNISQTISVVENNVKYNFVVYHGKEWVEKILEAKKQLNQTDMSNNENENYIEELEKLKKLLDDGIITQEEFNLKKRIILKI